MSKVKLVKPKATKTKNEHVNLKVSVRNSGLLRDAIVQNVQKMDFYFENSYEEAIELLTIAKEIEAATSISYLHGA